MRSRPAGHAAVAVATTSTGWKVLATALLDGAPAVAAFAATHQASSLVRLAPLGDTIARLIEVPVADAPQMMAAAGLLAEGELPPSVLPHRRAGGLLPGASRPGIRQAMAVGWLDRGGGAEPLSDVGEVFCPPAAAIAFLRGEQPCIACTDPAGDAYAVLAVGAERGVMRIVLEDASDAQSLAAMARNALLAAAASVGESADVRPAEVMLDASSRSWLASKVDGFRDEQAWIDQYALALGAAMVALTPEAACMARLTAQPPRIIEPTPVRWAKWLSQGARPWAVGAAACIVLLLAPWGLVSARDAMLTGRVRIIEEMKRGNADVDRQAALYAQLDISRWPLSKLLADVSGATPVGVVATDLRLAPEQGFSFQGTATSAELVNVFQRNLGDTKLFRSIKVNRTETTSGGSVEFNLSADLIPAQAHAPVKPASDFAAESLSKRLHGVEVVAGPSTAGGGEDRTRRGDRRGEPEQAESRRPVAPSDAMPPAVTDEEIKKMDRATANRAWVARKVYVQKNPTLDPAVKQRLQDEEAKIRAHAATAPGGGT
ncbi:MAG: PilN domain-containing protein [Phycisphaerae bacterium]